MENFKLRLIAAREEQGINQSQLSKLSGVTSNAISMLESGQRKPGYYVLIKLADALGVTCDYLTGRDAANNTAPLFRNLRQEDRDLIIDIMDRLKKHE